MRPGFLGLGGLWVVLAAAGLGLTGCAATTSVSEPDPFNANASNAFSAEATLAAACSGCHLRSALPGSAMPDTIVSLDGYSAEQLTTGLQAYKQDPTGSSVMHRLARGYTDQQILAIAGYLALQSEPPAASKGSEPND